jgi:hypothetical protein
VDAEIQEAEGALRAHRAGRPEVVEAGIPELAGHCLVIVPREGPIDVRYPRDPAERRRRPL